MKQLLSGIILMLTLVASPKLTAQQNWYITSNYEIILSFADLEYNGNTPNNVPRFSPWISFSSEYNYDFSNQFGVITGLGVRNIGFIYDVPNADVGQGLGSELAIEEGSEVRKKFRNYSLAVPLGIKIGNMNKTHFFGGYEIELPFHYKEKTFVDGNKRYKKSNWFDSQIPTFYHTAFAGVQLPGGAVIRFKYYFTDFFNQDQVQESWSNTRNYYPSKANVFYVSLVFRMLKNSSFYYEQNKKTYYSMNAN